MDIAKIFHQQTKQKYEKGSEKPTDFSTWPKEWATIYFKEYPRLAKVLLPKPDPIRNEISNGARKLESSLGEVLLKRKSEREFNGEPINLNDLSHLLFYSAGIIEKKEEDWNKTRRAYPSGGGRFPLEVYLFNLQASDELKEGIYHYNVKEHSLEKLLEDNNLREQIYPAAVWQEMMQKAPLVLAISAVFDRNMMKYKNRGYRYVLFEAGHLGQNIYLAATALGLKCCALGGFGDDNLHQLLDVDGESEAVLYLLTLGR